MLTQTAFIWSKLLVWIPKENLLLKNWLDLNVKVFIYIYKIIWYKIFYDLEKSIMLTKAAFILSKIWLQKKKKKLY